MSDMTDVTEGPTMSPEEMAALDKMSKMDNQKLINKIKYLGMQMETMDPKEKLKFSGQFGSLQKSLGKLRRLLRKNMPADTWQWTIWISVILLILIYGFFGYKLYKSLVERDRKRQEKLKAKQSKKKK